MRSEGLASVYSPSRSTAEGAGHAKTQRRLAAVARRIEGSQQQRGALEVVGRSQLDLRVQVGPVAGERLERRVPLRGERRARDLRRRLRLVGPDELERAF